jgi:LuxR family maltose regulon positive regulatory protein
VATPLLRSKTRVPDRRPGRVDRARLLDRLERATATRLAVVSAPAGYGKTTLLTEWLATRPAGAPVAWLALEPADDDPAVFWAYLLAAVDAAVPGTAEAAGAALAAGEPHDAVATTLLNDLNDLDGLDRDLLVVLDDVHVLRSEAVLAGLRLLVEHLPARVHLVLAARAEPDLPLPRLRARGELVELRAEDLRFTPEETAAYLAGAGVPLDAADLAAVARHTEGWAAAVQLVVLALQDSGDVAGVLAGLSGDHRHVADYLVDEVLGHQPPEVRAFLLRTSVLSRLTGPLCDAVTGGRDGAAVLEALDRANLFLVPLDDGRRWFRYHHLFAEVLADRLGREQGADAVADLHRRAARWHAEHEHGDPAEAVRHALAGQDHARAAELVEAAVPAMRRDRRESTLRGWIEALPADVVGARPVLALGQVGALLAEGRAADAAALLEHVERGVAEAVGDAPAPVEVAAVAGQAAVFRAALAQAAGDGEAVERHARRATDLLGPDEHLGRGAATGLLGLAAWSRGDLDEAERWWSASLEALLAAGHHADALGAVLALGDIRAAQGRLAEAADGYARALARAEHEGGAPRGTADMHVGLASVLRERGELDAARGHLDAADALGDGAGLPQNRHRRLVAEALLHVAEGDADAAVALLDEAERAYVGDFFPDVRPVAAVRAGVQARAGLLEPARRWARGWEPATDGAPRYVHEYEHLTHVRVLLAEHRAGRPPGALVDAERLLDRVLAAAEDGGRTGSVVEALVLRALVRQADGDVPAALAALDRAVRLAAGTGHVRVLVDEGPPVTALLGVLALRPNAPAHVTTLLASVPDAAPTAAAAPGPGLLDPLSARERDVLRLLATELDGPEIARHLGLSLNTVRTHTASVYRKLGVHGRRAALRRAEELGLLRAGR